MIPTAKLAQKHAKLRAKHDRTFVTLKWLEWPNGKPDMDPTTGAYVTGDATKLPVSKSASVRAFVHFINPITSGIRVNAEVQAGDVIVDFPLDLLRVTDAGDTSLTVGQVVDEVAFSQANRISGESAMGTNLEPSELEGVSMEFSGRKWVQKAIGEELAANWDTMYAGININRAFLLTKA